MRVIITLSLLVAVVLVPPGQTEGSILLWDRGCSPRHCIVGPWQPWGTCTRSSRGRCEQQRRRPVITKASCGGFCTAVSEKRTCSCPGDASANSSSYTCYGDIRRLRPTGASAATAHQDLLPYTGVPASNTLVAHDYSQLNRMKSCYDQVGRKYCLSPSLIAAFASRESRAGKVLYYWHGQYGWGDCRSYGCRAYGILQCDIYTSGLGRKGCLSQPWNSCGHVDMMASKEILVKIRSVQAKFPTWPKEHQLQGGVAAYNFGVKNVRSWEHLDIGTTGNDYSNDVVARAQYLMSHYGWN